MILRLKNASCYLLVHPSIILMADREGFPWAGHCAGTVPSISERSPHSDTEGDATVLPVFKRAK